ncbi:DNA polymerase IV [Halioglobus japonicus]|uniref:DNA polymerase IV n=1 Tax=Halioglobus japonicus TaxID=930805 RepID=A0AAP8SQ21_9GAMM|nr:DNA polymerase IV [Halioglobus japonicus]AQA20301.1 DNA polymerase IV [Halioglobus japonicus]PLW87798.1 DNA polymerase IV [Halioglobus japonicus]GHD06511.1 DNA polymerase IV [Halioglobus japonicus]
MSQRKIIHIDADSFYASVEMREDPSLVGHPIAVGGRTGRGVIATCNYEARKFGVHSAMPSSRARQLCPQLQILKPRFELYREVSRQFHQVFNRYTDVIEPLSLDEAYLDVSAATACRGSATLIAEDIRASIKRELNLTVSAGVAPNKFLAKVGSDWNKPDGCFTIAPEQVAEFVADLPVAKINGVGSVTAAKLEKLGATTCGELQKIPLETLARRFGKYGIRLSRLAHGDDNRPVQTSRIRKSISVENTYADDLKDTGAMQLALEKILEELESRFHHIDEQYHPHKRFVKVKFNNFEQTTIEEVIPANGEHWLQPVAYRALLERAWQRQSRPVRLLGAGLRLNPRSEVREAQLALFEA